MDSYTERIGSADYYLTVLNNIHQNEGRDIFNKAKRKLQSLFIDFLAKSSKPSDINDSFDIYHSFSSQQSSIQGCLLQ